MWSDMTDEGRSWWRQMVVDCIAWNPDGSYHPKASNFTHIALIPRAGSSEPVPEGGVLHYTDYGKSSGTGVQAEATPEQPVGELRKALFALVGATSGPWDMMNRDLWEEWVEPAVDEAENVLAATPATETETSK